MGVETNSQENSHQPITENLEKNTAIKNSGLSLYSKFQKSQGNLQL